MNTDIKLLKNYEDVSPFLSKIEGETKKYTKNVGFFPFSVYEDFCKKGNIWVAVDENNNYLGHIMFATSKRKNKITIEQTFVSENFRYNKNPKYYNIGTFLVKHLIDFGEENHFEEIRARVADDLEGANKFYQKMGLDAIQKEDGGKTTGRKINVRIKYLKNASWLFDLKQDNPIAYKVNNYNVLQNNHDKVVLDLNILNDLNQSRGKFEEYVHCIIKNSLRGCFNLYITPEMKNEINRNIKTSDDSLLKLIRSIPVLGKIGNIERSCIFEELRGGIFKTLNPESSSYVHKISDLKHLTYCIENKCSLFITRDEELIKKSSKIYDKYKVEITHPKEFIDSEDFINSENLDIVNNGISYSFEKDVSDTNIINSILKNFAVNEQINLDKCNATFIKEEDRYIAVIIFSNIYKQKSDLISYIFCDKSCNNYIYDSILEMIFEKIYKNNLKSISIFSKKISYIHDILTTKGFKPYLENSKVKYYHIITPLIISHKNWSLFCNFAKQKLSIDLDLNLRNYNELKVNGLLSTSGRYYNFYDFEKELFPSIIIPQKRNIVLIPIKQDYAMKLFGDFIFNKEPFLFSDNKPALLSLEKAYFKTKGKGCKINQNDLVLFYTTNPIKAIIGIARVIFSENINMDKIPKLLNDKGVIEKYKLSKITKDGEVHTILFDNFIPFKEKVDYKFLKDLEIQNVQTVRSIEIEKCLKICKKGGIYEG